MKKDIKITILMPSYNNGAYIAQAIDSVLSQTVNDSYQLIIADDCSTDESQQIIQRYVNQYPDRIKCFFSEENRGLFGNLFRIYKQMKTEYFCVLDSDDYWSDKEWLQKGIAFLEKNKAYTIYGANTGYLINNELSGDLYIQSDKQEYTTVSIEDFFNGKSIITNTCSTIFRNVVFTVPENLDYFNALLNTEAENSYRGDTGRYMIHLKYGKAKFVNERVSIYRIHKNGIWTSAPEFRRTITRARAFYDYSNFYKNNYHKQFWEVIWRLMNQAAASLYHSGLIGERPLIKEEDWKNYYFLYEKLRTDPGEGNRKHYYTPKEQVLDLLCGKSSRKLIAWGTGENSDKLITKYNLRSKVSYFVDCDVQKQNCDYMGKRVCGPEILKDEDENKYIVIVSMYYEEIIEYMEKEALCNENYIINLYLFDQVLAG